MRSVNKGDAAAEVSAGCRSYSERVSGSFASRVLIDRDRYARHVVLSLRRAGYHTGTGVLEKVDGRVVLRAHVVVLAGDVGEPDRSRHRSHEVAVSLTTTVSADAEPLCAAHRET